ncbi:hypothetical protein [Actinomadura algeriensis]|uniref:Uncharacterized protein n=1 Tax=Actinomadura algeriensis TaxID=1679523 RepID=A0ABR9JS70_9ACTN|nr:hypothetical protein [Actinomadura algeriensis]MBE1533420.1 hypothetical protein [Actinomadura algeriensis]
MVSDSGGESSGPRPSAKRRGGTRRRPRRESALVWWAGFAVLAVAALWLGSWRTAFVCLLGWCLYQFALVPTLCRVLTPQGYACTERARGRLFACKPEHQRVKTDALWRTVGRRRRSADHDVHDGTGVVVVSGNVRGRLTAADRALLLLAAAGTIAAVAAIVHGFR